MTNADPRTIYLMQGWLFLSGFLLLLFIIMIIIIIIYF